MPCLLSAFGGLSRRSEPSLVMALFGSPLANGAFSSSSLFGFPATPPPLHYCPPSPIRQKRLLIRPLAFQTTIKTLALLKPTRDLRTRLTAASSGLDDAEAGDLNHFIDLLEHCLALNPDKRIKPTEALKHPFFTSWASSARR